MATSVTNTREQTLEELKNTYLLLPNFDLCISKQTLAGYLLSKVCVWDQSDARFKRLFEHVLQPSTAYTQNTLIEDVTPTVHPSRSSYLQEGEKLGSVNQSLFKILTGRLNFLEKPNHVEWLGYVLNFLRQNKPELMEAVCVAQSWQKRLATIAARGKNAASKAAFNQLSQEILEEMQTKEFSLSLQRVLHQSQAPAFTCKKAWKQFRTK